MSNQSQKLSPLTFSNQELNSIIRMAEASIISAEAAHRLYGNEHLIDTRAAAGLIQSKCKNELIRREIVLNSENEKKPAGASDSSAGCKDSESAKE